jgi:hypothetical protein
VGQNMTKAAELAKMGEVLTNSQIGGRRNMLYNPKFDVSQRGTSFSGSTTAIYSMDRWKIANGSSFDFNVTVTQSTTVPSGEAFTHSLKVEADAAVTPSSSENGVIQQTLEAQDVKHLKYGTSSAESLTLSFFVRSNKTGTYCVQLMTNEANSTASNRYIHIKEYSISSADTWEKKTLTFTGLTAAPIDTTDNLAGFRVIWHLTTGSSDSDQSADTWIQSESYKTTSNQVNFMDDADNEWYLCGCQLEVGSQATPFEHRSFGEEITLCRRYCNALMNYGAGDVGTNRAYNAEYTGSYTFVRLYYPQMRTEPDTVTYGTSATVDASDYSSNGLLQLLASSSNWRIYDVIVESEL